MNLKTVYNSLVKQAGFKDYISNLGTYMDQANQNAYESDPQAMLSKYLVNKIRGSKSPMTNSMPRSHYDNRMPADQTQQPQAPAAQPQAGQPTQPAPTQQQAPKDTNQELINSFNKMMTTITNTNKTNAPQAQGAQPAQPTQAPQPQTPQMPQVGNYKKPDYFGALKLAK